MGSSRCSAVLSMHQPTIGLKTMCCSRLLFHCFRLSVAICFACQIHHPPCFETQLSPSREYPWEVNVKWLSRNSEDDAVFELDRSSVICVYFFFRRPKAVLDACPGRRVCWAGLLSVGLLVNVKNLLSTIPSTDAATTTTSKNQTNQFVITQFMSITASLSITPCIS